jgi:hypothetical protein
MTLDEILKLSFGTAKHALAILSASPDPTVRMVSGTVLAVLGITEALMTGLGPDKALARLQFLADVSREIDPAALVRDDAAVADAVRRAIAARDAGGEP